MYFNLLPCLHDYNCANYCITRTHGSMTTPAYTPGSNYNFVLCTRAPKPRTATPSQPKSGTRLHLLFLYLCCCIVIVSSPVVASYQMMLTNAIGNSQKSHVSCTSLTVHHSQVAEAFIFQSRHYVLILEVPSRQERGDRTFGDDCTPPLTPAALLYTYIHT